MTSMLLRLQLTRMNARSTETNQGKNTFSKQKEISFNKAVIIKNFRSLYTLFRISIC